MGYIVQKRKKGTVTWLPVTNVPVKGGYSDSWNSMVDLERQKCQLGLGAA